MKGHPYAQLAQQYWKEAETDAEAWRDWEYSSNAGHSWFPCNRDPQFDNRNRYRRKPRTININGFEVPEPLREAPEYGAFYWIPSFLHGVRTFTWNNDGYDNPALQGGVVHLTREAAELHAEALLSFTRKQP